MMSYSPPETMDFVMILFQKIVHDKEYQDALIKRARAGTLPPELEVFIHEVASGAVPIVDPRPEPKKAELRKLSPTPFRKKD